MANYYATVLHNFVPGSDRELALKAGERVLLFNWDDPEWWYGDLHGKSGYFPSTHVELLPEEDDDSIPPPPPPVEDDEVPPPPPPHAVGLWDCIAETQHELSFRAGEHLSVLDDTNPDWLYVELNNKRGYVPRNFVDYSGTSAATAAPAVSANSRPKRPDAATLPRNAGKEDDKYVAIYDFPAQTLHQISLKAGDFVLVLEKSGEWWKGELNGKTGLFPRAYVDVPSTEAFALIEKNNRDDVIVTPPPVPMGSGSFITQNPNINRSATSLNKLAASASAPEPEQPKATSNLKPSSAATIAATRAAAATSTSSSSASSSVSKAPAATSTKTTTTTPAAASKPAASASKGGKICKGCQQTVSGAFMEVDDGFYHKSCFVCALCSSPLKKFFEKDDRVYCGDCFTKKVDVIPCGRCGKALGSDVVKACGKRFHEECFRCFNCKKPFNDNLVTNRDGQPWCDTCVRQVVPKNNPTTRSTGPPKNAVGVTTGVGQKKTRTVPSKFQQQKMKYVSGLD